jgi:hypothetical protein
MVTDKENSSCVYACIIKCDEKLNTWDLKFLFFISEMLSIGYTVPMALLLPVYCGLLGYDIV